MLIQAITAGINLKFDLYLRIAHHLEPILHRKEAVMFEIMKNIVAPIIAAIITSLIAIFGTLYVAMQNKDQFFSNIVSRERMAWIKEVRACCIRLCSICEQYENKSELPPEKYEAFLEARNGILIHLDPLGRYTTDDRLIDLLIKADFDVVRENIPEIRSELTKIFKMEWDVVKLEAGNSPKIAKKIEELREDVETKKQTPEEG